MLNASARCRRAVHCFAHQARLPNRRQSPAEPRHAHGRATCNQNVHAATSVSATCKATESAQKLTPAWRQQLVDSRLQVIAPIRSGRETHRIQRCPHGGPPGGRFDSPHARPTSEQWCTSALPVRSAPKPFATGCGPRTGGRLQAQLRQAKSVARQARTHA